MLCLTVFVRACVCNNKTDKISFLYEKWEYLKYTKSQFKGYGKF